MPIRDLHATTGIWVADQVFKYSPRGFTELPRDLYRYAVDRIEEKQEYDPPLCKRLGTWVYFVIHISEENSANLSLLLWCQDKCRGVGMVKQVDILQDMINRYSRVKFPEQDFDRACRVMKLDADARERLKIRRGAA